MKADKFNDYFTLTVGIALAIFGILGTFGVFSFIEPRRTWLIFFFAAIMLIWSIASMRSRKKMMEKQAAEAAMLAKQISGEAEAEAAGLDAEQTFEAAAAEGEAGQAVEAVSGAAEAAEDAAGAAEAAEQVAETEAAGAEEEAAEQAAEAEAAEAAEEAAEQAAEVAEDAAEAGAAKAAKEAAEQAAETE